MFNPTSPKISEQLIFGPIKMVFSAYATKHNNLITQILHLKAWADVLPVSE